MIFDWTLSSTHHPLLPIWGRSRYAPTISLSRGKGCSNLTGLHILLVFFTFVTSASSNDGDLLAGTLKTFQRHACKGAVLPLQCPFNTTLDIIHVNYGGAQPPLCPFLEGVEDASGHHSGRCSYPSSVNNKIVQTVLKLCHRKSNCSIPVPSPSDYRIEDPCPYSNKYVEVAFKCRPAIFINEILCEGEKLTLDCGSQSRIAIYSSTFGRSQHGSSVCPQTKGFPEEDCLSKFAIDIIMNECHGYPHCEMMASAEVFGRPCPPEYLMYLKTLYTCVPSWILKQPDNVRDTSTGTADGTAASKDGNVSFLPKTEVVHTTTQRTRVNDGTGLSPPRRPLTPNEIINCTVAILSGSQEKEVGIITEWMRAVAFINKHYEKFLLYLILGLICGVLACALILLVRYIIRHKRLKTHARDTGHFVGEIDDIDGDLDMITPTSSSSEGGGYSPAPPAPHSHQNQGGTVRFNTGPPEVATTTAPRPPPGPVRYHDVDLIPPRSLSRENNHFLYN